MTDTNETPAATTIVVTRPGKSAWAAFFLTLLFGPLGLLYASVGGGIFLIVVALVTVPLTAGAAALLIWPVSIVWGIFAAMGAGADAGEAG